MVDGHVIGAGHLLTVNIERGALRSGNRDDSTPGHVTRTAAEDRSLRSGRGNAGIGGTDHGARHVVARRAGIDGHLVADIGSCQGETVGIGLPVGAVGAPLDGAGRTVGDCTADGRAREGRAILGRNRHVDDITLNLELVGRGIDGDGIDARQNADVVLIAEGIDGLINVIQVIVIPPVTGAHGTKLTIVVIRAELLGEGEVTGCAVTLLLVKEM